MTKPTKFFIHGFLDSTNTPWWIDMKNAILAAVNINCNIFISMNF